MITGRYGDMEQISIHALREEGDRAKLPPCPALGYFYPRPPRGGRHRMGDSGNAHLGISIHALREEGDVYNSNLSYKSSDFYPRPPRGGRPGHYGLPVLGRKFLSTPSARRATPAGCMTFDGHLISIHALREEGDHSNSTDFHTCQISIHALREEGDPSGSSGPTSSSGISIHALREEGDLNNGRFHALAFAFLSTPSARRATLLSGL